MVGAKNRSDRRNKSKLLLSPFRPMNKNYQGVADALSLDSKGHRKFVRVVNGDVGGFVQFEFAIGWPDLSVELILRRDQFEDFCKQHQVEFLTEPADAGLGH